jgi:hypothetical protein
MIKKFKEASTSSKPQIEKIEEKNKNDEKIAYRNIVKRNKEYNNNNKKIYENNIAKVKTKCLNDQKVFDEPKNKIYVNYKNFSYQKKILKSKNNSVNNVKKMFDKKLNTTKKDNRMIIHNKTLSFNNNFIVNPELANQGELNDNYANEPDEEINNKLYHQDNLMNMKYAYNNPKKPDNTLYQNIQKNKMINNNSNSNVDNNHNTDYQTNRKKANVAKSESKSDLRNKTDIKINSNDNRMYTIGSPMPFNKMRNYRNVFLKENNLEQDYIFYQTLPNLCHTLKRNESNSSYGSNKIEEIRINMKSSKKPDNKKEDNILNKTNSYFYCRENALYLPGKKNEINLQEEEENKNYQILNKKQKNYEKRKKNIIDPDKSFEKMKKLYKTNSTNLLIIIIHYYI